MSPARFASLVTLSVAAGCLQPGSLPEGQKLLSGRDIGDLGFVLIDGAPWVSFSLRKAPATPTKGAVSDLWISSWDGTQQRQVVADRSGNWGAPGAGGSLFVMVDEQQVTGGGADGGRPEPVGTLVRVDSQFQPNVRFENVSNFSLNYQYDNRLLYREVTPDGPPGLFLWDGHDRRRLGDVPYGSLLGMEVADSGTAYFVLGSNRVLSRLGKLSDDQRDLHGCVSRFLIRWDEKYAALSLSEAGTTTTVVLDVESGKEIPLARPNPCCWIGFANPDLFTYSQSASGDLPAEYHTLDLTTGTDTGLVLPAPLVDFAGSIDRPGVDEVLYLDSQYHGVFFGKNDRRILRPVPVPMLNPIFSPDGRYLIYVDPQPTTEVDPDPHGPLMVLDSDFVNPPRPISTPGMTVRGGKYFFIDGPSTDGGVSHILVFWSNIVRSSADLYFANHETGELKVVANAIGNVTVDSQRIFGTVRVSGQDGVGDLVVQDVQDSVGRTMAHAVTEATQWSGLVAYVVRGRALSDHDGLWCTILAPPSQDGGQ